MTAQGAPVVASETPPGSAQSLGAALSTSDNALNAVRLGLALLVIFGHAFPLGGFDALALGPVMHAGWHGAAVEAFFAISGFLILGSAVRLPLRSFLWRRFLRIYPGYVTALLVTAFVIAPIGALLGAVWDSGMAIRYVVRSLTLKAGDLPVGGGIPWPRTWNGSLWTLFYEALAYVGVGVFVSIPGVRAHLRTAVGVLTALATASYVAVVVLDLAVLLPEPFATLAGAGLRLWGYFAWGMLGFSLADRITLSWRATVPALIVTVAVLSVPALSPAAPILLVTLTVSVLGLGALASTRVGSRNDISYGVYVYAFPIQQLLILAGIARMGWLVTATVCALVTLPVAWCSWQCIERPALALKRLV